MLLRQATLSTDGGGEGQSTRKIPREFGRYRIVKRLGEGGMGAVYLAHDTQLDRQVALKIPRFSVKKKGEIVDRFFREARAAATIRHPNVCPVYDVGENDGIHYLTMAYIKGHTLSEFIRLGKPSHRSATEWVLRTGGSVKIVQSGTREQGIRQLEHLPNEPFRLKLANLEGERRALDRMDHLAGLSDLELFYAGGIPLNDLHLEYLDESKKLRVVHLWGTRITDSGIARLVELHPALVDLQLFDTAITDEALAHIGTLSHLQQLTLDNTAVTDAGIEKLKNLSQLKKLGLSGTRVTPAGVTKLQDALPKCKIQLDASQIQQTSQPTSPQSDDAQIADLCRRTREDWQSKRFAHPEAPVLKEQFILYGTSLDGSKPEFSTWDKP